MKLLFLSPQPFFEERGTPIAVKLALEVISQREDVEVDLLTYHLGEAVEIPHVNVHRIPAIPFITRVTPGISLAKLLCDLVFLFSTLKLVLKNRSESPYELIHAVEESVFIAWLLKVLFGIPYIYDMDSSLSLQLTEKWSLLKPLYPVFDLLEKIAISGSTAVVPVCDALAEIAERHGSSDTHILRDISLLDYKREDGEREEFKSVRSELSITEEEVLCLYIGNLESYQGIDLLIEAAALAKDSLRTARIVVIGGRADHITAYKERCEDLGLEELAVFVGPRPVEHLGAYLAEADVLLSPRTKGNNTPMKIYSYLHSGKAILATALPTHTQVLRDEISMLAKDNAADFSVALAKIVQDSELRKKLGDAARQEAIENYTYEVFSERLNRLYDRVGSRLEKTLLAV